MVSSALAGLGFRVFNSVGQGYYFLGFVFYHPPAHLVPSHFLSSPSSCCPSFRAASSVFLFSFGRGFFCRCFFVRSVVCFFVALLVALFIPLFLASFLTWFVALRLCFVLFLRCFVCVFVCSFVSVFVFLGLVLDSWFVCWLVGWFD